MKKFWRRSKCERIREMFSPYIDEQLGSLERDAVRYHLEVCEDCRRELESLKLTVGLLRRLPPAPLPRSFTLARPVEARPKVLPTFTWLRPVAVTVVVLFLALLASDLGGLFVAQHGPEGKPPVTAPASPELTLPPGETPEVGAPLPEKGKAPEEVSPGAPFAVEKRGLPHEAELIPPGLEGAREGLAGQTPEVSPIPPAPPNPGWVRPLEVALGLLSGLLLGLLLVRRRGHLRRLA
ncbi:MAG: hypothetical protein DRI26_06665 [Chloroflexi bacterium]|nr:MAG: hypothetical protein DRI26_06665 [Chloroflexota bacterium]